MVGTSLSSGTLSLQRDAAHKPTTTSPASAPTPEYVVAYARVVDDKTCGVHMAGVYFGGVGSTFSEAEQIAREVVNTTKGGTILPRIAPIQGQTVMEVMRQHTRRFRKMEIDMFDAEDIIARNAALVKANR